MSQSIEFPASRIAFTLLLAMLLYAYWAARSWIRYKQFYHRFDYWTSGFLFDKSCSNFKKVWLVTLWIAGILVVLLAAQVLFW
jgi:hypothetical protein